MTDSFSRSLRASSDIQRTGDKESANPIVFPAITEQDRLTSLYQLLGEEMCESHFYQIHQTSSQISSPQTPFHTKVRRKNLCFLFVPPPNPI